jgi:hypothetical protein
MKLLALAIALILADSALTYVAVGHLGAYEAVLVFVNKVPSAMWLVAAMKILGLLIIWRKVKKYGWIRYGVAAVAASHFVAVVNNVYWLLWRLALL